MPLTFNAIYLGNVATIMDPTEGNTTAENAAATGATGFVQTWGSTSKPLAYRWVSITSVDNGGTVGTLDQNNNLSNDQIIVTREGGQTVTQTFDAGAQYLGRITYLNGTQSVTGLTFSLIQTTSGDVYLVPALSGTTNAALSLRGIRSITLNSMTNNTFGGMQADRPLISFFPCFTRGTLLAGPAGPRAVETITAGQWLTTLDNGPRRVRWVGHRRLSPAEMAANPKLAPIRIKAGALGCGLPERDLLVSPQHRVLMNSAVVMRATGKAEVLVAAHRLTGLPGIDRVFPEDGVEYWHVLFEGHEVLFAEGAPAESLWPGREALKTLDPGALDEIRRILPGVVGAGRDMTPARPFIEGKMAARLVERHAKNGKSALSSRPVAAVWSGKDKPAIRAA
ncbi:MAG: hypothetical protein RIR62_2619 [Pseudomonadota bacterium]|jgi:hypothetical protein